MTAALASIKGPYIDWAAISPLLPLLGGAVVVLLVGLLPGSGVRTRVVPGLTLVALGAGLGLTIWQWNTDTTAIAGALQIDDLSLVLNLVFITGAIAAVILSLRERAADEAGHGEYYAMLLSATAGMFVLSSAENLVTLFIGLELLSIPLYVLCATDLRREASLESGLKYLIIGSVGSATLLYGLALIYGATGSTDFGGIAAALTANGGLAKNPLMLTGIGLAVVGLAFKSSIAPFHQWTPDVYEGAPTPITAFMSVATKAAAFGIFLRFTSEALLDSSVDWQPILAVLAAITIIVGNVGALGQSSVKRMLAWSSVAQAGYLLVGVTVATKVGVEAAVFYLGVYVAMNLAAFSVVVARERESAYGDDLKAYADLGRTRPVLAWPMTIAMLALAGFPLTGGFIGKIYLLNASVNGGYAWLGVMIVIGSMISLGYYLKVVTTMWMRERPDAAGSGRPVIAGGAPEADQPKAQPELVVLAVVFAAATIALGVIPGPLSDLAVDAGRALSNLL
ncbi:MAG: NADH-quinone oxidoreductase subunit N [Solirubrobacteraceae bacterium]